MENWARTKKLNYDLGKWFGDAWNLFKPHMWEFILLAVILMIPVLLVAGTFGVISVMDTLRHPPQNTNPFPLVPTASQAIRALGSWLFGAALSTPLIVGIVGIALKALRNGAFDWDLLWTGFRKWPSSFVIGLISGGISVLPALFPLAWILLPLYLVVGLWGIFAAFSLSEPGADLSMAMGKSLDMIKSNFWWAALFALVAGLASSAGMIACCVGIFFSVGFYYALLAVAYNDLSGQMYPAPAIDSSTPPAG